MKNIVIGALLIAAVIYAVFFKPSTGLSKKSISNKQQKSGKALTDRQATSNKEQLNQNNSSQLESNDQYKPKENSNIEQDQQSKKKRKEHTKVILDRFLNETEMIIPKIDNMYFTQVDIDNNNLTIIQGKTPNLNRSLTVIATRGVVTADKALEFLKQEGSDIPDFGDKGLILKQKVYTVPSIKGSGFTEKSSVFMGKPDTLGIVTNGILLTRKDGKGTYLYLLKTKQDFFDKNEGAMDKLYNQIKLIDKK